MKIKDGQEFLEKLSNLDPALVEEAGQAPEPRESGWGLGLGTWLAVAACVAVLCLPVILRLAFAPPAPQLEETTAAGADVSHQAPADGGGKLLGEEGMKRAAGEGGTAQSAESAVDSQGKPGVLTMVIGCGEEDGLTVTEISREYAASFEDGLPAEEYFKYNSQTAENRALWDDYLESDFGIEYTYRFREFPQLNEMIPEIDGYQSGHIFPEFETDNSKLPSRLCFQWYPEEGDKAVGYITVNIVEQAEEIPLLEQESLREYIMQNQETLVDRDGIQVAALGGLNTEKTLSFWLDGRFYRIYGDKPVTPEIMVQLLDWLLEGGFDLEEFSIERAVAMATLQDYPDAFAGYYPTDPKWVPRADKSIVSLYDEVPAALELDYQKNMENHLISYWMTASKAYAEKEMNYATLDKYLPDLTEEDVLAYLKEQDARGSSCVSFWWNEDVQSVFWYRPGTGRHEEIWEFIQYLQSDDVKLERMIGDIIELRPYTSQPDQ